MSEPKKTTEEIVSELQQGRETEENFRILYERHYGQLFRFFRNKQLPPEDCRDLIQKVFIVTDTLVQNYAPSVQDFQLLPTSSA
jgi:DNA-directed RNA polymerase specialized sigma24 family protein